MALEQSGHSNWIPRFLRGSGKRRKTARGAQDFNRRSWVEQLEERRLLVTRVWLDFGNGYTAPATGPYAGLGTLQGLQPAGIHDALRPAAQVVAGNVVYEEELGLQLANTTAGPTPFNFVGLNSFLNSSLSPVLVNMTALQLEESITAQIQQALEPYDIQVISSFNSNIRNFGVNGTTVPAAGSTDLSNIATLDALNDTGQQFGRNDVFVLFSGIFNTVMGTAVPSDVPISADFAVQSPVTQGAKPSRLDTGAIIDANYWINRVLGPGGTGGSINVALANAAMYAIGWDMGLSEVENGTTGPFSNFSDPNVQLINQSNAMTEGGFFEANGLNSTPIISDTAPAAFNNFPMMQDGADFQPMLRQGTLAQAALFGVPNFPLPPQDTSFNLSGDGVTINAVVPAGFTPFVFPDATLNEDPSVTVNTYQQLANDADIGINPDIAYVSGTGAADQIFITKLNAKQAQVTVKAYTDNTYTTLISDASPGVISTYTYTINLSKPVIPGRKDDGLPFKVVVDGTSSDDQVFLDPTLGVHVEVHGGADVKTLNITGNGAYNLQYTPNAPPQNNFQGQIAEIAGLIPQGLVSAQAGTLIITGSAPVITTTTSGKKTITRTVNTPFTTTVSLDHFNPNNASGLLLDNFNQLSYVSPGFLNNQFTVTSPSVGVWSIGGEVDSPFFPPALNGAVNFTNVKTLTIDTSKGASNDDISFSTANTLPTGLQSVNVNTGTGADSVSFDDSASFDNQNYVISPTLFLPSQPAISPFLGYNYSGVEVLNVTGTQGNNSFFVTPSKTTFINIDGQDPPFGTLPPDGDKLSVRVTGTTGASESDDGAGTGSWTFASGQKPINFTNIENIVQPTAGIVVESGDGTSSKPLVKVLNAETHQLEYEFYAFEQTYRGGVHVAVADVNADGTPDLIVTPGVGRSGEVKVYDGAQLAAMAVGGFVANPDSALLDDFFPEGPAYKNGLYVAAGDLNGDTLPDFAISLQRGAPKVDEFYNQGGGVFNTTADFSFAPYAKTVNGAVIAAGDTNGDGTAEIITAPGPGTAAQVKVFDAQSGTTLLTINAFTPTFRNGVSLAVGDVNGDGLADIVVAAGPSGNSQVQVYDATIGKLQKQFQAFTTNTTAAVRLAAVDPDGAGFDQIYAVQALGGASHQVKLLDPLGASLVDSFIESQPDFAGGFDLA